MHPHRGSLETSSIPRYRNCYCHELCELMGPCLLPPYHPYLLRPQLHHDGFGSTAAVPEEVAGCGNAAADLVADATAAVVASSDEPASPETGLELEDTVLGPEVGAAANY